MKKIKLNRIFDTNEMPHKEACCVYGLISGGEIIYIGQTKALKQRVHQHLSDGKEFDSFEFTAVDVNELNDKEAEAIVKNNPHLNKILPSNSLYMATSKIKTEINNYLNSVIDGFTPVFTNFKDRKYISGSDYRAAMKVICKHMKEIEEEIKFISKGE